MPESLLLIPIGLFTGVYGTLIGVGGGIVVVPLLLWKYPEMPPEIVTSISLAVVFFNSLSGSIAYARLRRIDYRSGLLFAIAIVPGAALGALSSNLIHRNLFNIVFGALLTLVAGFLVWRPQKKASVKGTETQETETNQEAQNGKSTAQTGFHRIQVTRTYVDRSGHKHVYSFNPFIGTGWSLIVGYVSSILGIGGGIIHVPAMIHILGFPVHVATATSHFVLVITALTATIVHLLKGDFAQSISIIIPLVIGVVAGAQLGASFSNRLHGNFIIRILAIALGFLGIRILLLAF